VEGFLFGHKRFSLLALVSISLAVVGLVNILLPA